MKHYIAQLAVQNGEFEYTETLKLRTNEDPDVYLDKVAATWYDTEDIDERRDGDAYWHCGEMLIRPAHYEQVTKEVADAITIINYI